MKNCGWMPLWKCKKFVLIHNAPFWWLLLLPSWFTWLLADGLQDPGIFCCKLILLGAVLKFNFLLIFTLYFMLHTSWTHLPTTRNISNTLRTATAYWCIFHSSLSTMLLSWFLVANINSTSCPYTNQLAIFMPVFLSPQ